MNHLMSQHRRWVRVLATLMVLGVIGVVGAAGGFVIGRRWPIERFERFWPSSRAIAPPWREFTRTDIGRYQNAQAAIGGTLYLIGGFWTVDTKATPRVDALDLTTGAWRRLRDMPVAMTHANAAVVGNTVWIVGGFEGDHPGPATTRVWRWDPHSDTWSAGPPLPAPRASGALVAVGSTLHYFGGYLPDRSTDSPNHWRLVAGGATWEPRAPLPHPRGHLSGVFLDGWIYAISGNTGHDPMPIDVTFAERYNPVADRWESIRNLPFPVSHTEGAIFAYDGRIITLGGRARTEFRENQDDILSFNPATGRWTHLGRLPEKVLGATAVVVGDTVTAGLGGVQGNNPANLTVWRAELRNIWRRADSMPAPVGEVAGGILDNALYLVGEGTRESFRYDLAAGTWTRHGAAARPAPGHHHAAEVLDGKLWLLGGLGGSAPGVVQILDPETSTWQLGPPMPFRAGSSASSVIDGRFFVAGGIVGNTTTGAAAMLDPVTMTWTSIAPMPKPRNHAASATDGERLYVFGGRGPGSGDANVVADGFDDVQIYDPRTNTWRVSDGTPDAPAPLPQARGGMGKAVWINEEFWVLGGETKDGAGATRDRTYARVDIYNPRTNLWRAGPPLGTARHGIFPLLHEGQIIVAGGGVVAGHSQTDIVEVIWPANRGSTRTAPRRTDSRESISLGRSPSRHRSGSARP